MKKAIICLFCMFILTGCGVSHKYNVANGINETKYICIIDNPTTKEGFKNAMITWLKNNNYEIKLLPQTSSYNECEWALTYYGKWSWDLALYLSDAEIKAYRDGQYIGNSTFHVTGGSMSIDPGKYGSAEIHVQKMMSNLFNQK